MAIHLQEVGGKYYKETMKYASRLKKLIFWLHQLIGSDFLQDSRLACFNKKWVFLDTDWTIETNFTVRSYLEIAVLKH